MISQKNHNYVVENERTVHNMHGAV